ncbi:molybdopterin-containing oxidoreductase family iron-sulfur binding subunit [Chitinophaga skermanii]|uniref:Molybdopterin-containing oxidoreductase family iron-sulfur binding subunit n=1 Tax=Chitinophaga skermanii TaxID=331697 RepID=A0A327QBP6_9BACT|nr:TAT-variant-translocated molybdopterin oxidoreductase [Chitinophaga skermanii]RAJ01701.1 molybdopterin-containing oxidoreductase family iron-sulfur binding subunit [Chitinophaga skermanii]
MEQKKYWKGLEELHNTASHQEAVANEFRDELPFEESESLLNATTPRRDFLKYLGFTTAAATIAASCEIPVKKAIPYVNKPEDITPGVPNLYASTYVQDGEFVPVVVKTREGRPIKIEGNDLSTVTGGSTTARVQGSVLGLYDVARLRFPAINSKPGNKDGLQEQGFAEIDKAILAALAGKTAVLLTSTITSPSTKKVIGEFLAKYPGSRHVTYDTVSYAGMILANEASYGKRALPSYHFENAKVVVNFGADFLGTWLNPAEFTKQFGETRKINQAKPEMSKHFAFESTMSLTGANADERYTHRPSELGAVVLNLYAALGGAVSAPAISDARLKEGIAKAAKAIKENQGKTLVVAGSNDVNIQIIVNAINNLAGANGTTIDWNTTANYRQGIDSDMVKLVEDMNAGTVGALLVYGANPVYDYFDAAKFKAGLAKVATTISFNDRYDETTELVKYIVPAHHYLESWGDVEAKSGYYSFIQPTIAPLFKTRAFEQSLLTWTSNPTVWEDYLKSAWIAKLGSQEAWDKALQDGVIEPATAPALGGATFSGNVADAAAKIPTKKGGELELVLYEKVAIGNGKEANNPWLQEMPDPITRSTWDNYALISNTLAKKLNSRVLGDDYEIHAEKKVLKIKANGKEVELPLLILPGIHKEVIAIAVGYGRGKKENIGKAAGEVGQNAYPFVSFNGTTFDYFSTSATAEDAGKMYPIGLTQTHNSYEGRPIVKETTLEEFIKNPKEVNADREALEHYGKDFRRDATLYRDQHTNLGIKWGMSIDLNTCFGCGACTIACQAENNVSVVGKEQVVLAHEMHWLRIDRYFSGDENNPEVVFQPMLCQHCDNAPCENVCPVAATNHSSEGINQMAYNRCIGTRYCANNCPYKVRRFNWRDWNGADSFEGNLHDTGDMNDDLTRMVLNPDVVVRARGTMEKCSFCVQRLQDAKLAAKKAGHPMKDGAAKTACQQACSADAIVFGNVNDKDSAIYKLRNELQTDRLYYVLEETHVLPSINYLAKIRNKDAAPKAEAHGHGAEAHKEAAHH